MPLIRWTKRIRWIIMASSAAIVSYNNSSSKNDNCDSVQHRIAPSVSTSATTASFSALSQARQLSVPQVTSTAGGELEHVDYWSEHSELLRQAWKEWEQEQEEEQQHKPVPVFEPLLPLQVEANLEQAVNAVWKNPSLETETKLRELFTPVVEFDSSTSDSDKVYQFQLLSESVVQTLRQRLEAAHGAGIPLRRPNGMNRYGLVIDNGTSTDGACSDGMLLEWQTELVDRYIRPLARLWFHDYIGNDEDDSESYGFTIRYKNQTIMVGDSSGQAAAAAGDVRLAEHSDASVVTLNVNLNTPNESFEGSSLYFVDPNHKKNKNDTEQQPQRQFIEWDRPGQALLHRGWIRHAALPIEAGERYNLVIWLFGIGGYVRIAPYEKHEQFSVEQRWSVPSSSPSQKSILSGIQSTFDNLL